MIYDKLTVHAKINKLYSSMHLMNAWQKDFVSQMWHGLDGCGALDDEDVYDYLTPNQVETVEKIYKEII